MSDAIAVILGSAFESFPLPLARVDLDTEWGNATLWRVDGVDRPAYVLFRHGRPHRLLPTQIDWRANAGALRELDVGALLVTSSVGVLDPDVPLNVPCLVDDLFYLDNRLADGSACTMFTEPSARHGHLVIDGGLLNAAVGQHVRAASRRCGVALGPDVVFAYVGGPRTKTPVENRYLASTPAQVNSMTLAPEVVLANELEIPTAGLVVGHKYSVPGVDNPVDDSLAATLEASRQAMEALVVDFLQNAVPVKFGNHLYRFE